MTASRVLVVEDAASLALAYAAQLEEAGREVEVCGTAAEAQAAMTRGGFDVVLLDLQLPDGDGLDLLEANKPRMADTSIIVITADGSLNRAVTAMRLGAYDFLVKPVAGERLLTTVRNAAERGQLSREVKAVKSQAGREGFHGFVGRAPVMQAVYRAIENVSDSNATVFITGESGTGKEVAAEAIHEAGRRAPRPFVAVNCGAIPENLLESELFGHVKGSFTGAVENRVGAAKEADGGTLFLDEICEMELKLQVKLLRFLQTGMIQRVGSSRPEPVDVRVVCATNRNPALEVAEGRFREDLFYRLNVIPLELPPLRARGDDVRLLAEAFMRRFGADEQRELDSLSPASMDYLDRHSWPGNVRELQNAVRRAVVMGSGPELDLQPALRPTGASPLTATPTVDPMEDAERPTATSLKDQIAQMTMDQIERAAIDAHIERAGGNVSRAARNLKVSPSTIYRKLERWNLETAG